MSNKRIRNLLVIGMDTVAVANSARKAGYKVYAADYFGDVDLRRICSAVESMITQKAGKCCGRIESEFKPETFLRLAKYLAEEYEIDGVLLSSGLDDASCVLYELSSLAPIVGNQPKTIVKVRNKLQFFKELQKLRIAHPETRILRNAKEAETAAAEIGYPIVIKPLAGFGGTNIRVARNLRHLTKSFKAVPICGEFLVQKFIEGVHASVSFLATDSKVKVLAVNEQLLGIRFLSQAEPFSYCGNITPLSLPLSVLEKCKSTVEKMTLNFGLEGSNGVDMVISREGTPHVVEVNPRFQGSLECVERVLGINLVEAHINACLHGSLPNVKEPSAYCTRLILYAPNRVTVPDFTALHDARDIPFPRTIIEKEEPLCSVIASGRSRNYSLLKAKKLAKAIYNTLSPA